VWRTAPRDLATLRAHATYWFFGAGLTNVGVTIYATDLQSGTGTSYTNTFGTSFQPIQDTSAFHTCP
jgi:hypothetical protein